MVFSFVFKNAKERSSLYFCLRDGKERVRIATGIVEDPKFYNKSKQQFEGCDGKYEYNEILNRWRYIANREIRAARTGQGRISVKSLVYKIKALTNGGDGRTSGTELLDFYESWATGRIKSKTANRGNLYHYNVFAEFARRNYACFNDVDYKYMDKFKNWLVHERGLRTNTVGSHIKDLKAVMNLAYKLGLHRNDSYRLFSKPSEEVDNVYLTEEEVRRISGAVLPETLAKARDLFLLGCLTAMRYSDCISLTTADVEGRFIHKRQEKTNGEIVIPVHPRVREIIGKYDGPPKLANPVLNRRIKEVCRIAGITEKTYKEGRYYEKWQLVTSHTARRTGATLLYLQGVPAISIMMITGHRSESSFLKYIKVTLQENAEMLSRTRFFNG